MMKTKRICLWLGVALLATSVSCQSNIEYIPTVRLATSVASSYTANIDLLGYAGTVEYDDSSETMVAVGLKEKDRETGRIKSLGELVFSSPSFESDTSFRIAGGGRYYLDSEDNAVPFLSFYSVSDTLTSGGDNIGIQLGLSLGGGIEYMVNEKAFVDLSFSYLVPLLAAEYYSYDANFNSYTMYTELDGWTINLGVGTSF